MPPNIPIPTDNIYKFACLFGLALIITSIFSFVSTYAAFFESRIKYVEVLISLDAKSPRSKIDDDLLTFNKKLIEISKSNETVANFVIGAVLSIGLGLSFWGATRWYQKIQSRDDRLAQLQIQKLKVEIIKLRVDIRASKLKLSTVPARPVTADEP